MKQQTKKIALRVFDFERVAPFLKEKIDASGIIRGYQARLAGAAKCQESFFSQSLKEQVQLTPDHIGNLAEFFEMTEDERNYFLNLSIRERAASAPLVKHCTQILLGLKTKNSDLSNLIQLEQLTSPADEALYYSSWLYAALHIAVSIPRLQKTSSLAAEFGIEEARVRLYLKDLERMGLVKTDSSHLWNVTGKFLHLGKTSPFFSTNHVNWRFRAVQQLQSDPKIGIHYTSVFSISKKDRILLQEEQRKFIERIHSIVGQSNEEELCVLGVDLFHLNS